MDDLSPVAGASFLASLRGTNDDLVGFMIAMDLHAWSSKEKELSLQFPGRKGAPNFVVVGVGVALFHDDLP